MLTCFNILFGLPLAFGAAYGAAGMLIGNGILQAAHLVHYTTNASAAAIGAAGVTIASLLVRALPLCGRGQVCKVCIWTQTDDEGHPALLPWYVTESDTVVVHTLSDAIGTSILRRHRVYVGTIDVLHATYAGELGGAILGPGAILIAPHLVFAALGIKLLSLWLAMMMGLRWVSVRLRDIWDGISYKSSYCATYGDPCGDDHEINEELAQIPDILRRFDVGLNIFTVRLNERM
ncbi:hypothetical protein CVT25_013376 [Psilocybe cyanescens]|uniref:Uncharacterized protein n=1 Tax=Psilocybe cyanescens TaxID=93625 RepID=A0A409WSJ4_PSICY|nr:hypothetical protein CVT25_013376 [Psilocybe cyanescens]